jgi:NADPH:quinone reductase-like Zn-dependent oxidoreductase
VDYRHKDFVAEILALTDGEGVDLVLDPIGGAHWGRSLDALAPSGRLVVFGVSTVTGGGRFALARMALRVPWVRASPFALMNANHGVLGVNLGHLWEARDRVAGWARTLLAYAEAGKVKPNVDRVFSFDEAAEAHRYIEGRKNRGKVLLRP